jgi:hypothetical protein
MFATLKYFTKKIIYIYIWGMITWGKGKFDVTWSTSFGKDYGTATNSPRVFVLAGLKEWHGSTPFPFLFR